MADFSELPVDTGVGDWHFNRYRIAFRPPAGRGAAALGQLLFSNFPNIVASDYTDSEWGDHPYGNLKTVHFHGILKKLGVNLGKPHSDWVTIIKRDPSTWSFTVQTLKREFFDAFEDVATGTGGVLSGVLAPALPGLGIVTGLLGAPADLLAGVHYNRMHFLAGRRAWRVGEGALFGLANDVLVLETIAVERFSAEFFRAADGALGLEDALPNVWIALLYNFIGQNGLVPVDQPLKPGWQSRIYAKYIVSSFSSFEDLKGDREFRDAYRLFPDILP